MSYIVETFAWLLAFRVKVFTFPCACLFAVLFYVLENLFTSVIITIFFVGVSELNHKNTLEQELRTKSRQHRYWVDERNKFDATVEGSYALSDDVASYHAYNGKIEDLEKEIADLEQKFAQYK